jgi:hypothetical protein
MALQGNFATAIGDLVDNLVASDIANINEAIFQETFTVGNFAQAHTLLTGRRQGQVQPIVLSQDYYGSMPVGDQTSCDLNECDLTPNYSAKEWNLAEYNCRIPICMRSFDEEFLMFWNMYRQGLEDPTTEPDAQAFLDFIEMTVRNQVLGTQWRVGYWGDTSATTNDLIKGNDGYFAQAEAGSGVKQEITAIGDAPTGEEIYDAMKTAYETGVQTIWGGQPDVVWKTTYAVAAKLVAWLNTMSDTSQYNCECFNPDGITAARRFNVEGLRIFGIPVEAHREIDLSATAAGQTDVEDKYKILLTRKSNLLVGVNTENKLEGFDIFFDKKDRKVYIDTLVRLGVMIPLDEYVYITTPVGS